MEVGVEEDGGGAMFLYFTTLPTSIPLGTPHTIPSPWDHGLQPDIPGCPHERALCPH